MSRGMGDGFNIEGGGGGGDTYTNVSPTTQTIGGIPVGSTFSADTMQQMWDLLLYPYQAPSFTLFSIVGQSPTLEVGDSSLANPVFSWNSANQANITPLSVKVLNITGGGTLLTNLPNSGSQAVVKPAVHLIVPGNYIYRVSGTNTHLGTFTKDFTIIWEWRYYYGESVSAGPLSASDIQSLDNNLLGASFSGDYPFLAGGYKYICYPQSWGVATVFKDVLNNLDVPFEAPYVVPVTNSFGVTTNFLVFRTTNILGSSITISVG